MSLLYLLGIFLTASLSRYLFNTCLCINYFSLYLDTPIWSQLITSMSLIITDMSSLHSKSVILMNGYGLRKQIKKSSKGSRKSRRYLKVFWPRIPQSIGERQGGPVRSIHTCTYTQIFTCRHIYVSTHMMCACQKTFVAPSLGSRVW